MKTTGAMQSRASQDMQKKGKKSKVNPRRLAMVIIGGLFLLYFVYIMIWQQVALSTKNKEIKALENQIAEATARTERLQAELDNLDDPEYLEQVAREKLGLVRPNERVFVDANKSEANVSE